MGEKAVEVFAHISSETMGRHDWVKHEDWLTEHENRLVAEEALRFHVEAMGIGDGTKPLYETALLREARERLFAEGKVSSKR
jgi:hypothetical protein